MSKQRLNILLIDDNPIDAEVIRRRLARAQSHDVAFSHCVSEAEAREAMERQHFDLLLIDYQLTDVTGVEIVARLRSSGDIRPMIVVTGRGGEFIATELISAEADGYVSKNDLSTAAIENAIRCAIERFRRRLAERHNGELVQELRSAENALERRNKRLVDLKSTAFQFVDNVSHEFRTPLTVIKEFAGIIRDGLAGPVTAEQREYLTIIDNRVDDLTIMVEDMLDISKLEAGILGIARRQVRMDDVIARVRKSLECRARTANVKLHISCPPELPNVYCDAEKIGRVIINFVVNALKFSPEGASVRLWACTNDQDQKVVIGVTDEGPGIPRETLHQLFSRFRQVGGVRQSTTKGYGLGLSIAKELVHLNFGDIDVESDVGRGSTFRFTIPFAQPQVILNCYIQRIETLHTGIAEIALLRASVVDTLPSDRLEKTYACLEHQLRRTDLLLHVRDGCWIILVGGGNLELQQLIHRIETECEQADGMASDCKLPAIELHSAGVWGVVGQQNEIRRSVQELVETTEIGHVQTAAGADY